MSVAGEITDQLAGASFTGAMLAGRRSRIGNELRSGGCMHAEMPILLETWVTARRNPKAMSGAATVALPHKGAGSVMIVPAAVVGTEVG